MQPTFLIWSAGSASKIKPQIMKISGGSFVPEFAKLDSSSHSLKLDMLSKHWQHIKSNGQPYG
jgi:hypothetical protein